MREAAPREDGHGSGARFLQRNVHMPGGTHGVLVSTMRHHRPDDGQWRMGGRRPEAGLAILRSGADGGSPRRGARPLEG